MNCIFVDNPTNPLEKSCRVCGRPLTLKVPVPAERCIAPCRSRAGSAAPDAAQPALPCVHRGAQLRVVACDVCGERGQLRPVFACALHGECVWRRYWRDSTEPHERECIRCPDLRPE